MSNYSKTTDFAAKDSLPSGDSGKIIRGSEFETEFDNISTAIATKADAASPTFTGTVTIDGLTVNGNTVLGNAATDTVTVTADIASNLIPSADDTYNLGASGAEWNDLFIDGTANIDSLVAGSGSFTSISTTGNVTFGDNDKAIFGAGSDLQIYHDGSNSYIEDAGGGNLRIRSNGGTGVIIDDGTFTLATFDASSNNVKLYHNGNQKLETTSAGIDVTGTVTADGLTVDGNADVNGTLDVGTSSSGVFNLVRPSTNYIRANETGGAIAMGVSDSIRLFTGQASGEFLTNERLRIASNGDISFYEDTGTTAKFFWDASAESLGIGTVSPSANLHVSSSGDTIARITSADGNGAFLDLGDASDPDGGRIVYDSGSNLGFSTQSTERMRITSSGNVGIGTSSPSRELSIGDGTGSPNIQLLASTSGNSRIEFGDTDDSDAGEIQYVHSSNYMQFTTNGSEAMRISSGGNLLVGTTTTTLTTNDGIILSSDGFLHASRDGNISGQFNRINSDGDIVRFRRDGTTIGSIGVNAGFDLVIDGTHSSADTGLKFLNGTIRPRQNSTDSDGNVSLGAGSFRFQHLFLSGDTYLSNGSNLKFKDSGGTSRDILSFDSNNDVVYAPAGAGVNNHIWKRNGSEYMRLDTSGNLLVGKTSSTYNTAGTVLGPDGRSFFTADGSYAGAFNRKTSDGDIVVFSKNGTAVGSIGTDPNGYLYSGAVDTALVYDSGANSIQPYQPNTSSLRDNAVDLGGSSARFRDLYLSGGAYLGGTAADNKLDDYEEGTFTVAVEGSTTAGTGTYATRNARYTKIGNIVHARIYINMSAHTGAGNLLITGLPFNSKNAANEFVTASIDFSNGISKTADNYIYGLLRPNTSQLEVQRQPVSGTSTVWNLYVPLDTAFQAAINITYTTD